MDLNELLGPTVSNDGPSEDHTRKLVGPITNMKTVHKR